MLEAFPISPPDSDEPGIPVAGLRFSGYPLDRLQTGTPVVLKHAPQAAYPHACAVCDRAGTRFGWVPDGLAQVLWEVVADPQTQYDLIVSHREDRGILGVDIWVNGLLYLAPGSVT